MVDQTIEQPWPYPSEQSLLPPNRTEFETHVEQGLLLRDDTLAAIDAIRGVKFNPPDELLPWLVWEYGLTGIVPYLSDLRIAIREGLLWQKERGTEAAVLRALSWIDIALANFEHETPGVHWNEFQIDTGRVPTREELRGIIALSEMSSPARSKLRRLHHGCDRRRFVLSESDWGDLLADYSGVRLPEHGGLLAMAFCHHENSQTFHNSQLTDHSLWLEISQQIHAWPALRLSFDPIFGETPAPNHPALIMLRMASESTYEPPLYWPDATWQNVTWTASRLTAGTSVQWLAGESAQAMPATGSDLQTFLHHDQTVHFDIQTDSSVTWLTGAESEPYNPIWRDTGWTDSGWQHDILIESDYS